MIQKNCMWIKAYNYSRKKKKNIFTMLGWGKYFWAWQEIQDSKKEKAGIYNN